jgi:hypothetical protein
MIGKIAKLLLMCVWFTACDEIPLPNHPPVEKIESAKPRTQPKRGVRPAIADSAFIERLSPKDAVAAEQRARFVRAWKTSASFGLSTSVQTVEGTPIHLILATEKGVITLITDYSDDEFSNRSIASEHPVSVSLGVPRQEEQHPLRSWFPDAERQYIRCVMADGSVSFF